MEIEYYNSGNTIDDYNKITDVDYDICFQVTPVIHYFQKALGEENARFLSVGCGFGHFEDLLLPKLKHNDKEINLDILDFSHKSLEVFEKNCKKPYVVKEKFQMKMQELQTENKYDLIWFFNSLYLLGEKELRELIPKYKTLLKPNGKILIFQKANESFVIKSSYATGAPYCSTDDIKKILEELKIEHRAYKVSSIHVPGALLKQYLKHMCFGKVVPEELVQKYYNQHLDLHVFEQLMELVIY